VTKSTLAEPDVERCNALRAHLVFGLGTIAIEGQELLLDSFVGAMVANDYDASSLVSYCDPREAKAIRAWKGIQVGAGQSFGIAEIFDKQAAPQRRLQIRAESIGQLAGTWLFELSGPGRLTATRDGQAVHLSDLGDYPVWRVLADVLDGGARIGGLIQTWLADRDLEPEEITAHTAVVQSFVRSAVLLGLEPHLTQLTRREFGYRPRGLLNRRSLVLHFHNSYCLVLEARGLPVSTV
jgi:hypothetical protein